MAGSKVPLLSLELGQRTPKLARLALGIRRDQARASIRLILVSGT
jgi:hypothetical protein